MNEKSLQESYAPHSICFGCGPANKKGLRIRSFKTDQGFVATWKAEKEHQAFPGMLNGGIIGALLDCHSNWSAAIHLMEKNGLEAPPCTVTADYSIRLKRPTPADATLELKARILDSTADKVHVEAELWAEEKLCASCEGHFVAVKPGHPAYHRWG